MKLSVKISILVALVSVIPAIIVLAYTLWTIQQNNLNSSLQDVLQRVQLSADRFSYELESSQREVNTYVQMDKIQSMKPQQFLPFLVQELNRHNGHYEKFIVGTLKGHFYNTAGGNPNQNMLRTFNDTSPSATPKNIRSRDYWQHTVGSNEQQEQRSIISNPMISYTTGARQVVIASAIINQKGTLLGMLGASIDWDRILTLMSDIQAQQFSNFSWSPKMFLITRDGTYWYHWNPRLIPSLATDAKGKLLRDDNGQTITKTHSLAEEEYISAEEVGHITSKVIDFHLYEDGPKNERFYLFHAPIGSHGYTLGLTVSEKDLLPPLISYSSIIAIFLVTLTLVLIAANLWHRRNFTTPMAALMHYIQQLRLGNYSHPPKLNNREFNQVANTLNEMSEAVTERQQALKESEIRFDCAMAGTNDGLWDWDLESQQVYYSPRWCEMLGYQQEDLMPTPSSFTNLIHPADRISCEEAMTQFLNSSHKHYHMKFRMRHKNGDTVYILSRAFLVRDEINGNPIRLIGTHVDITDDKLHEEKISKLNAELEQRVKHRTHELEEANRKLEETSLRDGLTQVGNRRAMEADLVNNFTAYQRHGREYAVLLIDIDYFKPYNDQYGHPKGDEVLRNVAKLLTSSIRNIDKVYRYGGEEFLILMPDTDHDKATNIAERARANTCLAVEPHDQSPTGYITISIGVTTNLKTDRNWQEAVKRADERLYEAKKAGRNQVISDNVETSPIRFSNEKSDNDKLH